MDAREALARQVFAAWSSGDAAAPEPFFTSDAVLCDVASGRFEGWPGIRAFFASGLQRSDDLVLAPFAMPRSSDPTSWACAGKWM